MNAARPLLVSALAVPALLAGACVETQLVDEVFPRRLEIQASTTAIEVGETTQLVAVLFDRHEGATLRPGESARFSAVAAGI